MKYKFKNGGIVIKLQSGRKVQKLFDNVTSKILQNADAKNRNISSITGMRYEQLLKDEHPGLDLALAYAQPGNIVAKAFAPSMAKGFVEGLKEGDLQQAIISGLVPESKVTSIVKSVKKPISKAERLGIPKGERSNPKALEDPQYWGYQQWNDRYNAAVESGNWDEVQRLRDLHFKIKAINNQIIDSEGNPLTLYHGNLASEFQIRDMGLNPYSTKRTTRKSSGYFAVNDKAIADTYKLKGDTYELYGYANNPKIIDANGHSWLNVDKFKSTDSMVNEGFNNGHDAVIINNVVDYGFNTPASHPRTPFTDYVFKPGRVKLKNAIVEDGLMERIPIVKRDNFHNPDMRYKQGGIIKGQEGTKKVPVKRENPRELIPVKGSKPQTPPYPSLQPYESFMDKLKRKWSEMRNETKRSNAFGKFVITREGTKVVDDGGKIA